MGVASRTQIAANSGNASQARANLAVKTGGFSIGAFAASNRGKVGDFYEIERKVIGEGSYGTVRRCQFKVTSQWRALKTINKALIKNQEQCKEEMAIMKLLDHPNIVRLFETFEDEKMVYLVLELCTGGELFDRIVADGKFAEKAAACCVQQMLRAVNYMHQNCIMHRDLKPENWLLSSVAKAIHQAELKLIDFGLSKRFTPGEFASTKAGTPFYVAPEVLEGRYAQQSDVWSIGVIMYILLCGSPPFSGDATVDVLAAVKRASPKFESDDWKHVRPEAKQMLRSLLHKDPSSRITASDALQHRWILHSLTSGEQACLTNNVVVNLRNFAVMNKLKKASMNVIAAQLDTGTTCAGDLRRMFMAMDEDNNGTLSVAELREGLKKAGVAAPPDLQKMMDHIDTDGSGLIDYSEFMAATMDHRRHIHEDECWRAFKTFDSDGSGEIDKAELMKLLGSGAIQSADDTRLTEKEVDRIMKEVDLNRDGKIDFSEFLAMMKRMPKTRCGRQKQALEPKNDDLANIGLGKSAEEGRQSPCSRSPRT